MKGINKIEMNHETMCEAIQLWLDAKFKEPPMVSSVTVSGDGSGGYSSSASQKFEIVLKQREEPAACVSSSLPSTKA